MKKISKKLAILSALSFIAPVARCSENNQSSSLSESKSINPEKDDFLFDENSIYSSHSVKLALLLVANGASPEAQKEILDCYGFNSIEQANEWAHDCMTSESKLGYQKIQKQENYDEPGFVESVYNKLAEIESKDTLGEKFKCIKNTIWEKFRKIGKRPLPITIHNSIWIKQTPRLTFDKAYSKTAKSVFNAAAKSFKQNQGPKEINAWVEKGTNNKIRNLIPEGEKFDSAVVNAIYFKSDFKKPFEEKNTKDEDFLNIDGSKTKTKMMNATRSYNNDYYENDRFKSLRLDYENGCHIYFFVPQENKSLDNITTEDLKNIGSLMATYNSKKRLPWNMDATIKLDIKIPKFRDEYTQELSDFCKKKLGITKIFDENRFPLPNICNEPLYVSKIYHKAFIELDEKGTEAAAATAALFEIVGCAPTYRMEIIKHFHANKNFKYIITSPDNTIIFEGQRIKF